MMLLSRYYSSFIFQSFDCLFSKKKLPFLIFSIHFISFDWISRTVMHTTVGKLHYFMIVRSIFISSLFIVAAFYACTASQCVAHKSGNGFETVGLLLVLPFLLLYELDAVAFFLYCPNPFFPLLFRSIALVVMNFKMNETEWRKNTLTYTHSTWIYAPCTICWNWYFERKRRRRGSRRRREKRLPCY